MSSSVLKKEAAAALPRAEWRSCSAAPGVAGPGRSGLQDFPGAAGGADRNIERPDKEAYERGLREGEAAGARKALEQLQAAIREFGQSASTLAGYKTILRAEAERELVTLSLAVARKVIRRELSIDPNIVLAVVKSCLEELQSAEIYRLRLHPQDAEPVAGYLRQHGGPPIEIVPDGKISRGGAVFETSKGQLDARLETQLQEIERGLADR